MLVAALCVPGCDSGASDVTEGGRLVELSPAEIGPSMDLNDALGRRRSIRNFAGRSLTADEIGALLWAAQGVTSEMGGRTAPSAGGLYPLELYVATAEALSRYRAEDHALEVRFDSDLRQQLYEAGLEQDAIRDAPAVFIVTAVPARTETKYGGRAERYVLLEAGHAAQNLLLEAVALELGAVPIGAFDDDDVARILDLDEGEIALYLIPIGAPG